MPTYDYKCTACAHAFEHMQSMKDRPLRKCPKCGKNALERLIGTGGAVIFKGGGFYQTDYRSESYKKAAEAESKPAGESAKADAAKPDAPKPETASKSEASPAKAAPSKATPPSTKSTGESKPKAPKPR